MWNNAKKMASPSFRIQAALLVWLMVSQGLARGADQVLSIQLNVIKGENAFNDVKNKRGQDLEVEVLDQNLRPVQGATVVFRLPFTGAGGAFSGGQTTLSTTTGEESTSPTVSSRAYPATTSW